MTFCYHTRMNPIARLEKLPAMLFEDKASILLVYGNLKKAAFVVMQGDIFHLKDRPVHINAEYIDELGAILSELKLHFTTTTEVMENSSNKPYEHGQEVVRIFVAHDHETVKKLKSAFGDISNNHSEVGMLLGYPETSVKAFLTPDMLEWENHPVSTEDVSEKNMRLLGHRLSKKYWREEVKYLEASGNYLKTISPKIYQEITKQPA